MGIQEGARPEWGYPGGPLCGIGLLPPLPQIGGKGTPRAADRHARSISGSSFLAASLGIAAFRRPASRGPSTNTQK